VVEMTERLGALLDRVAHLNLWLFLRGDGRPAVGGLVPGNKPPPDLLRELGEQRGEVIAFLEGARLREWRWRSGLVWRETADSMWTLGRLDRHPTGAGLWRYQGEGRWRAVEGRCDVARECLEALRGEADAEAGDVAGVVPVRRPPKRGQEQGAQLLAWPDGAPDLRLLEGV
jgi:hypothetical protein